MSNSLSRSPVASLAAKLMADEGIDDYTAAKRKAAAMLHLPTGSRWPENSEIDAELRAYLRLFRKDEQSKMLADLRRIACDFMVIMQEFRPYLSGAVLDGTAGIDADIDIQLFTDSAKEVEIFLLNRRVDYRHETPRSERAEAVLSLDHEGSTLNLIVYPARDERVVFRTREGKIRPRARVDAVKKLLADSDEAV